MRVSLNVTKNRGGEGSAGVAATARVAVAATARVAVAATARVATAATARVAPRRSAARAIVLSALAICAFVCGCQATPAVRDAGGGGPDGGGLDAPIPPGTDAPIPPGTDAPIPPGTDAPIPPGTDAPIPPGTDGGPPPGLTLPPPNAALDYQLGGAYTPPAGVMIVSRDRTEAPAPGLYNICYVNGFQIQPGEEGWWMTNHPSLMLRDGSGALVIDVDWDEVLIDVRTPANRAELAAVIGDWIATCAADGFDAVEIDNLDTFSRSGGLITEDQAVAAMRLFSDAAHAAGLAIAQKNSAEIVGRRSEMATDFVVTEECNRWSECDVYTGAYGDAVLVIEYRRTDFDVGCAAYPNLSIVLRDVNLTTPGSGSYVYDGC